MANSRWKHAGNSPLNSHLTSFLSCPQLPCNLRKICMAQAFYVRTDICARVFCLSWRPHWDSCPSPCLSSFPWWAAKNSCRLKTTSLCEPCPFPKAHPCFTSSRRSPMIMLQPAPSRRQQGVDFVFHGLFRLHMVFAQEARTWSFSACFCFCSFLAGRLGESGWAELCGSSSSTLELQWLHMWFI